jgi:hypothetical protein
MATIELNYECRANYFRGFYRSDWAVRLGHTDGKVGPFVSKKPPNTRHIVQVIINLLRKVGRSASERLLQPSSTTGWRYLTASEQQIYEADAMWAPAYLANDRTVRCDPA